MTLRLPKIFSKSALSRRRLLLSLLALFVLLPLLLLLAAPTILSTTLAQNRLKSTLRSLLQGKVEWSSLQLSWTRGVEIRNLTVGAATGTLRQASIASIDCRPGLGFGSRSGESFGLDLYLHLHDLSILLAPLPSQREALAAPPADEEGKPDPLTALAQGLERFATLSWPLPVDLRVDIELSPLSLVYEDQGGGHSFRLRDGEVLVKIPSLERSPLRFSVNGNIEVDGHPLGALHYATEIAGLVTPGGRIVPAGAHLSTLVDLPGIALNANGCLQQGTGLHGSLHLDLAQLQNVAAPFLPATLPKLDGSLMAALQAEIDKEEDLTLSCTLAGDKLRYGDVGPVDFDLGQQLRSDHRRQLLTLGGGVLMIPQLLEANWEAQVEAPTTSQRRLSARLHRLDFELDRALTLAAPLLPTGLPQISGGKLHLRDLAMQVHGTEGEGELSLAQAGVNMQTLHLAGLALQGLELVASDLKVPLRAYFPAKVEAGLAWKIAGLDLSGAQPVVLSVLAGEGQMRLDSLHRDAEARDLSFEGSFAHQLRIKDAKIRGVAQLKSLDNDLRLQFSRHPDGRINVAELSLATEIAALSLRVAGKDLHPVPLQQRLQVESAEMRTADKMPQIKKLTFSIGSPGILQVNSTAALETDRLLTLDMQSRLDLSRLSALAAPLLPETLMLSGTLRNSIELVATLPDQPLPAGQAPLRSARQGLTLVQRFIGEVHLDGVDLRLPLAEGVLLLSDIKTLQPLRLHSRKEGKEIDLGGALAFDLRQGSVIKGESLPIEHGEVTLDGEVRDWDRAFIAQSVSLEPLGINERSELTLSGLATLLDEALPPTPATLLQRLDATLFSEIDFNFRSGAPPLLPKVSVRGKSSAGSRVDLRAGESLRLRAYADVDDLAVTMTEGAQLQGLQARFNIDRSLRIRSAAAETAAWQPLSTSLVLPLPPPLPVPPAGESRRLYDDLRGNSGGVRTLTLQSLRLPSGPLPLSIATLEAEIATSRERLGMNFLQLELLGGTLRASALLDLRPDVPILEAEALFTNLDLARLGRIAPDLRPGEAESSISGEGLLRLPLIAERRPLLEGLSLSGQLRRIGTQSFDRALASLDPYERNEAIMAQRKFLRFGQLQGVKVQAADGALSLSGALSSQGVTVALPRIDRLRLADLPIEKEIAPLLTAISSARSALELARADTIQLGAHGEISLRKEE